MKLKVGAAKYTIRLPVVITYFIYIPNCTLSRTACYNLFDKNNVYTQVHVREKEFLTDS